jgi:hypothetical protein
MSTTIKCPNCANEFELNESLKTEVEKELREKMKAWQKQKEDDFAKREKEVAETAAQKVQQELNQKLTQTLAQMQEKEAALALLKRNEIDLLKQKEVLEAKQKDAELEIEKRLLLERKNIETEIQERQKQLFNLKAQQEQENFEKRLQKVYEEQELKEKENKIKFEQQQKLINELKQKSEQGSMQLSGESQELLLEQLLKESFPFDVIEEVAKGVDGADCFQTVRNNTGQACGKIIYESKRAKAWKNEWIEKLKIDMRNSNSDAAILVTQVYPRDMEKFGEKDGVWVCSFNDVIGVASILRNGIMKVQQVQKNQENKGEKMVAMYNYLTSQEFIGNMTAMREGFRSLRNMMLKEREDFEKNYKRKEKQIELILQNSLHISGSVEGIAGQDAIHINLLDDSTDE